MTHPPNTHTQRAPRLGLSRVFSEWGAPPGTILPCASEPCASRGLESKDSLRTDRHPVLSERRQLSSRDWLRPSHLRPPKSRGRVRL